MSEARSYSNHLNRPKDWVLTYVDDKTCSHAVVLTKAHLSGARDRASELIAGKGVQHATVTELGTATSYPVRTCGT